LLARTSASATSELCAPWYERAKPRDHDESEAKRAENHHSEGLPRQWLARMGPNYFRREERRAGSTFRLLGGLPMKSPLGSKPKNLHTHAPEPIKPCLGNASTTASGHCREELDCRLYLGRARTVLRGVMPDDGQEGEPRQSGSWARSGAAENRLHRHREDGGRET
jgi:hypothetical protein